MADGRTVTNIYNIKKWTELWLLHHTLILLEKVHNQGSHLEYTKIHLENFKRWFVCFLNWSILLYPFADQLQVYVDILFTLM